MKLDIRSLFVLSFVIKQDVVFAQFPCNDNITNNYKTPENNGNVEKCLQWKAEYGVVPGQTWGSLPKELHTVWHGLFCDEISSTGKLVSCDDMWGWSMFSNWLLQTKVIVDADDGGSSMTCATASKNSQFCTLKNVLVDFSKMQNEGTSRIFHSGFVTLFTNISTLPANINPPVPLGFQLSNGQMQCDAWEMQPTFVMSHDDIYNFGHNMNDVLIVWTMITLSGARRRAKASAGALSSQFINIDGIRRAGPAGGFHRIMNASDPDQEGPFFDYYRSWFGGTKRGVDFGSSKVCFSELYFQPFPGIPYVWQDWSKVNKCSVAGPSPLVQSFSRDIRHHFDLRYGISANAEGVSPSSDRAILVLFENRTVNKQDVSSTSRLILNTAEIESRVASSLPDIDFQFIELGKMSFRDQTIAVRRSNILIGMHGAGNMHMVHMSIGFPMCCAFVEIIPHIEHFREVQGHGNMARHLGLHYFRHHVDVAPANRPGTPGTLLSADDVVTLITNAVKAVTDTPTCLNDARIQF